MAIIEVRDRKDLLGLREKIKASIISKEFPRIKAPFCCVPIEHCEYLFTGDGSGKKTEACKGCRLMGYCNYDHEKSTGLPISPITECDTDLLLFLEERDENIADWI